MLAALTRDTAITMQATIKKNHIDPLVIVGSPSVLNMWNAASKRRSYSRQSSQNWQELFPVDSHRQIEFRSMKSKSLEATLI
jgi:hypothetical protein